MLRRSQTRLYNMCWLGELCEKALVCSADFEMVQKIIGGYFCSAKRTWMKTSTLWNVMQSLQSF